MPFLLKTGNFVAECTAIATRFFYKHIHVSSFWQHTHLWIACMVILSIDFYNMSHVDMGDQFPHHVHGVIEELCKVIDDKGGIPQKFRTQASRYRDFVEDFECPLPTTCCYQRIDLEGPTSNISDHYYFVMDGLVSAYKIHNHMTMSFCGSLFQHNTSVPIYLEKHQDGKTSIYLHKHPRIAFLAWGVSPPGGRKGSAKKQKKEKSNGKTIPVKKSRLSTS
jgi:hypothetical protein